MTILILVVLLFLVGCAYEGDEPQITTPTLILNEVTTNNCTGLYDAYGGTSNWVELKNVSGSPIALSQYYLSNNREKPLKWQLGERILDAGTFEIVHLSGKNFRDTGQTPETIKVDIQYVSSWSDTSNGVGGASTINPYDFDTSLTKADDQGYLDVSASLYLADNRKAIGWTGQVQVDLGLNVDNDSTGSNYISLKDYNTIVINGFFEKDKKYHIGFGLNSDAWGDGNKHGVHYYNGLVIPLVGTGKNRDIYTLQINKNSYDNLVSMPDLNYIRISHTNIDETLSFTVDDIYFSSSIGNFHTNFSLSEKGDELYLSTADGAVVDSLFIPALRPDISYGINSSGGLSLFTTPTPGLNNESNQFSETLIKPIAVTSGGFYTDSVYVSLQSVTEGDIYFTTDGSKPSLSSSKYSGPFWLKETTVLQFATCKEGKLSSDINSETYFVNESGSMPVISIAVDPSEMFDSSTGMYMAGDDAIDTFPYFGGNFWDPYLMLDSHMEFFESSGKKAFTRPFGLKIHGGWSRGEPKKSLALMFKDQYGVGDLAYPIFPEYPDARRFKSLILRSGGGHVKDVMVYDGFNSYLTEGRDIEYQKLRTVKLFINGRYWGLYNIREKLNEHYFVTNFDLDASEINMIKDGGIIQQGSVTDYVNLINIMREDNVAIDHIYDQVKSQMDVHNFIDYMATQIFIVNQDWPANNIKWWKSNRPNSKWRWVIYDTDDNVQDTVETGFYRYAFNMVEFVTELDTVESYPNGVDATFLIRTLLENGSFKRDFINRTMTLLNTNFSTTNYKSKLDHLLSFIGDEYKRDSIRWDYPNWESGYSGGFLDKKKLMYEFAEKRPDYVRTHLKEYFSLDEIVSVTLETQRGEIFVNGMSVGSSIENGTYFSDVSLSLSLSDTTGFTQWSDGNTNSTRSVFPSEGLRLTAQFQ